MRLLLDEHYANAIAEALRAAGHDAVTVAERGLMGTDDEALLALASSESRALLTNNAQDFVPLAVRWAGSGEDHCGLLLEHPIRVALAKPIYASVFLVVNGVILIGAERYRRRSEVRALAVREGLNAEGARDLDTMDYREAGVIGVVQSTALIAGISRDGVVMTAGLARGLDNSDSARFAFLLATPPILAAGVLKIGDLTGHLGNNGIRGAALIAAVFAAATAVITVHFLTKFFKRGNLRPFGVYCILFGAAMVIYNA